MKIVTTAITQTTQKILISAILIAVVIGSIIYLNSQKAGQGSGNEIVTVTPRISDVRETEQVSNSKEEIPLGKNTAPTIPSAVKKPLSPQEKSNRYELAKEITTPDGFINTDEKPITINQYIDKKIILVDFWTYSCINCQRTTPYLNAWYEKYKDKGFVIIGIHTPEFEFEKVYQNVLEAAKRLEIKYPVVLDNDYSTWNAYKNRFWPRKYLIDIDGYIIYDHIGEGQYAETEQKIQDALKERMVVLGIKEEMAEDMAKTKNVLAVDFSKVKSPETYFGSSRNEFLGNGSRFTQGLQTLLAPTNIALNKLYLAGDWNFQPEFAQNQSKEAKIIFRYNAKNVYLVAGSETGVKIKIKKDGNLIKEELVKDEKLYNIIENSDYGEHVLEIIIENPGLRAFAFTFG